MGGVALARVVDNLDPTGQGRVRLELPWFPGVQPWARVAAPSAGDGRGMFFIPQVNDEVVVAFHHGDLSDPFVLGSLWGSSDRPPAPGPLAAKTHRVIRTPAGHELVFDDQKSAVTLKTATGQTAEFTPEGIVFATAPGGGAKVTLGTDGTVTIEAKLKLELKAAQVVVNGQTVEIKGSATTKVQGGGLCEISAGLVKIN